MFKIIVKIKQITTGSTYSCQKNLYTFLSAGRAVKRTGRMFVETVHFAPHPDFSFPYFPFSSIFNFMLWYLSFWRLNILQDFYRIFFFLCFTFFSFGTVLVFAFPFLPSLLLNISQIFSLPLTMLKCLLNALP